MKPLPGPTGGFCTDTSATGWTLLNDATENLNGSTESHGPGGTGYVLEFDKKNGTNFTDCGAYATLTGPRRDKTGISLQGYGKRDRLVWNIYFSTTTDLAWSFVRLGTDASNFVEFIYDDASHASPGWTLAYTELGSTGEVTGTGLDWDDIRYICVGAEFDGEDDALADIFVEGVYLEQVEPPAAT